MIMFPLYPSLVVPRCAKISATVPYSGGCHQCVKNTIPPPERHVLVLVLMIVKVCCVYIFCMYFRVFLSAIET